MNVSFESVKNKGYEFFDASKVYAAKAYEGFQAMERGPKLDVVLKTALVVFALGIFSSKLIALGGGTAAFIYFSRQNMGANQENRSPVFEFVEQHVANMRRWIDGGSFFEQPKIQAAPIVQSQVVQTDEESQPQVAKA